MIAGGFATLPVADAARATRFYVETLGMKLAFEAPGFALVDAGDGFRIALSEGAEHKSRAPQPGAPIVLFSKMAMHDAIAILENRGVTLATADEAGATTARCSAMPASCSATAPSHPSPVIPLATVRSRNPTEAGANRR